MSIESPAWRDWPVAALGPERYGHFVLFRLDPVASVANLEDEEASQAAARLPNDLYYLGIVMATAADRYWADGRPELNFRIYLVGHGPSNPPSACVPIAPAPHSASDRPPVELTTALPWPNLYIHSYDTITASITRIHDSPKPFSGSLSQSQREALERLVSGDYYGRTLQRTPHAAEEPGTPHSDISAGTRSGRSGGSEDSSSDGVLATEDEQSIYEKDDSSFLYGELYVDISTCPRPPDDPSSCSDCVAQLERIRDQWYKRKIKAAKAKRPQMTNDWIRDVQAAEPQQANKVPLPGSARNSLNDDDDGILPEDAVDERIDRDNAAWVKEKLANAPQGSLVLTTPIRLGDLTFRHPVRSPSPARPDATDRVPSPVVAPEPEDLTPSLPPDVKQPTIREDVSKPTGNRLRAIARAGITSLRSAFIRFKAQTARISGRPRLPSRENQ